MERWIYQPGSLHAQTTTFIDRDGIERAHYTESRSDDGLALPVAQYIEILNKARRPGSPEFALYTWEEIAPQLRAAQDGAYVAPWKEITEERFHDMLNVLPPERWERVRGVSIFRMSERTCGDITSHFAQRGQRYFEGSFRVTPYDELLATLPA